MRLMSISSAFFIALLILVLGGCALTVETLRGDRLWVGSPQFSEYAEDVFRRNNSTLTTLFDALELANDEDALKLEAAEERMIGACESLNSVAAAKRDGKELGFRVLRTISSTIRPCDEATQDTEQLIAEITALSVTAVRGN